MPSEDIKKVRELIAAQPPRNEMTIEERRGLRGGQLLAEGDQLLGRVPSDGEALLKRLVSQGLDGL